MNGIDWDRENRHANWFFGGLIGVLVLAMIIMSIRSEKQDTLHCRSSEIVIKEVKPYAANNPDVYVLTCKPVKE